MLQMANKSESVNFVSYDFGNLDSHFRRSQLSDTDHIFQTKHPSLYSLKMLIFMNPETAHDRLASLASIDLQRSYFFILDESLAPWIIPLLQNGAFDVSVGYPHLSELHGKLEYFFSELHQSAIFKANPPFKLDLTRKEQQLFDFFISHPQGVNRQELMTLCWKDLTVHPKTLDVHLFNLRQKLETVGAAICFLEGKWIVDFSKLSIEPKNHADWDSDHQILS